MNAVLQVDAAVTAQFEQLLPRIHPVLRLLECTCVVNLQSTDRTAGLSPVPIHDAS